MDSKMSNVRIMRYMCMYICIYMHNIFTNLCAFKIYNKNKENDYNFTEKQI